MERTERYNYVFDQYDGDSFIYDLKEDKRIEDLSECANILNKKEKEIESWKDGTMVVKLGKLEEQLAESESKARTYAKEIVFLDKKLEEKEKEETKQMEDFEKRCQEYYKSNQTAIAELNNILDTFAIFVNEEKESLVSLDGSGNLSLLEYIENRIDTLKGGANE